MRARSMYKVFLISVSFSFLTRVVDWAGFIREVILVKLSLELLWNQWCPLLQKSVCYYSSVREDALCKDVWESCELCFERILAARALTCCTSLPSPLTSSQLFNLPEKLWPDWNAYYCSAILERNSLSHWETLSFTFAECTSVPKQSLCSGMWQKRKKIFKKIMALKLKFC